MILLLSGYDGYAGVVLAVALAAASTCAELAPSPSSLPGRDLVLGLEVDQHVGAAGARGDLVLERVGGAVRVLERRPGAELDVEVDVAARARAAGAQLVVADDAALREGLDRVADGGQLVGRAAPRRRARATSAATIRRPVTTIAPAMTSATTGSSHSAPVTVHEREPDEHAERRVRVGAQVRGVALQRGGLRLARAPEQPVETTRFTAVANATTAMPTPSDSQLGALDQAADRA